MNIRLFAICVPTLAPLLLAPNSGDPAFIVASAGALAAIFAFWSKGGLSVLVIPLFMHWLLVATKPIRTNQT